MNGISLTLGLVTGVALAGVVCQRRGSASGLGTLVPTAKVRAIYARLGPWTRAVIEAAGDDPEFSEFDPNVYSFDGGQLEAALGVPVLGFGYSRVVVRVAPGIVAKLPWRQDGHDRNRAEVGAWDEASEAVQQMMLPPLGSIYPGIALFPEVKVVARNSMETAKLSPKVKADLRRAQQRWLRLVNAGAPGAITSDVYGPGNWGRYEGRLVLIDYEPEEG